MKKNLVMRIAAVVLMCTLVTACFASSTFARYTSTSTTENTVTVAKWKITTKADGSNDITADDSTFELTASTLYEEDKYGTAEENADYVAPGTCGSFDVQINNESDVDAEYALVLTPSTSMPANIKFYKEVSNGKVATEATDMTWTGDIARGESATVTVYWQWTLGDAHADDDYAGADFTIDSALTVDQIQ